MNTTATAATAATPPARRPRLFGDPKSPLRALHRALFDRTATEQDLVTAACRALVSRSLTGGEVACWLGAALKLMMKAGERRNERLTALEAENALLTGKLEAVQKGGGGCTWAGVHETGQAYAQGTLVTRRRGLWLALRDTSESPGMCPLDWKLVLREGKVEP